jgi:hypothetical protein
MSSIRVAQVLEPEILIWIWYLLRFSLRNCLCLLTENSKTGKLVLIVVLSVGEFWSKGKKKKKLSVVSTLVFCALTLTA